MEFMIIDLTRLKAVGKRNGNIVLTDKSNEFMKFTNEQEAKSVVDLFPNELEVFKVKEDHE